MYVCSDVSGRNTSMSRPKRKKTDTQRSSVVGATEKQELLGILRDDKNGRLMKLKLRDKGLPLQDRSWLRNTQVEKALNEIIHPMEPGAQSLDKEQARLVLCSRSDDSTRGLRILVVECGQLNISSACRLVGCVGRPAVSYQRTEIQACEAFDKARRGQQVLVLVDGGPGCGKTKVTNSLAQALELQGITPAYTGSTSMAAMNYPTVFILHQMMGFGGDTRAWSDNFVRRVYSNNKKRREVKARLGNDVAKKVLLVIDEISSLTYCVQFASTLWRSVV